MYIKYKCWDLQGQNLGENQIFGSHKDSPRIFSQGWSQNSLETSKIHKTVLSEVVSLSDKGFLKRLLAILILIKYEILPPELWCKQRAMVTILANLQHRTATKYNFLTTNYTNRNLFIMYIHYPTGYV